MRVITTLAVLLAMAGCDGTSGPGVAPELMNKVVSGRLDGISAKNGWVWGDGVNRLCQEWSEPFWFYGTASSSASSADVAVLYSPDILEMNHAEALEFSNEFVAAGSNSTVVFRGRNGFFGAWKIDEITDDGLLYGTWYFRSGGSGDFTAEVVEADYLLEIPRTDCGRIS